MTNFDRAAFWPAFKEAGWLRQAQVKQAGKPMVTVYVKYSQPTELRLDGAASSQEYQIKYQHTDLPFLGEGDTVSMLDDAGAVIRAERFKVRQTPSVSDYRSGDGPADSESGFFRHALLTRIV